jgi:hypothetical protein
MRRSAPDPASPQAEAGIAMLIAVLLLLLISAIGLAAIDHSGTEAARVGIARTRARSLYAADAGVQAAINQLRQGTPVLTGFEYPLSGAIVRSGPRTASAPQPIEPSGTGAPPEGYAIEVGGSGFVNQLYRIRTTGRSDGGAVRELEAKVSRLGASGTP